MDRRKFIGTLAGGLVPTTTSRAQSATQVRRVGFLLGATPDAVAPLFNALNDGLRDRGYVEGRNLILEARYGNGRMERLPDLAAKLVRLRVEVIVTGTNIHVASVRRVTTTVPIVMVFAADPVGAGFVTSLSRPGGNVTGLSNLAAGVISKHVELLTQISPGNATLAVLQNPTNPGAAAPQSREVEAAARALGLRVQFFEVRSPKDFDAAFARIAAARTAGVVTITDTLFLDQRYRIAKLASKNRVPTVFSRSENVDAGGLMSYGSSLIGQFRHAAIYVDKILKGAKPADLPVEEPTRLELVVNLKTAKAIGITIPQSILVRADRVIE